MKKLIIGGIIMLGVMTGFSSEKNTDTFKTASGKDVVITAITHSDILAWKIPWAEESGGLQSVGPQRVRHD